MKAAVFIPDCCSRARLAADAAKLPVSVRAVLDKYCCGEVGAFEAVKEIAQLCKKADGRRSMFGWTLIVQDCKWEEVEEVVYRVGGDIVYMR
jgi:hypothetical protein